jgi:hypothetical protein
MNDNKKVFDKFTIIIVDEDEFIVKARTLLLKEMGISPVCISYGNLRQKTSEMVSLVYNEGKYPVIFLGAHGSHYSETSDTLILEDLFKNFEQGGIIIPSSLNYYEQMNDWSYFIPKDERNWVIPKEYNVNLEDECNNFIKNVLHEGQEGIEFKNI